MYKLQKTSNTLNSGTWISLKISCCTYSIHQPPSSKSFAERKHKHEEKHSSIHQSQCSASPGPLGSSFYRTLKEISSSVQRNLYSNSVFRDFKRKIFYAWTAPSLLSNCERKIPPALPSSPPYTWINSSFKNVPVYHIFVGTDKLQRFIFSTILVRNLWTQEILIPRFKKVEKLNNAGGIITNAWYFPNKLNNTTLSVISQPYCSRQFANLSNVAPFILAKNEIFRSEKCGLETLVKQVLGKTLL